MDLLDGRWVTDGGLETDLIFNHGIDLPEFAAFPLVQDVDGSVRLREYYAEYAAIAEAADVGLLLETATWRANPDGGRSLGYDASALARANRAAVGLARVALDSSDVRQGLVSGCIGPRGDGYLAGRLDPDEAATYHAPQAAALAEGGADLLHAMTMTGSAEAIGIVRAARSVGLPVSVSFTVETDGRLPDGSTLSEAIAATEAAAPADYYGLNCAHPSHVLAALDGGPWQEMITFFRPNASTLTHAELDVMDELDAGDVSLLVRDFVRLREHLPAVSVVGGCCGTDSRHVAALWDVPRDLWHSPPKFPII